MITTVDTPKPLTGPFSFEWKVNEAGYDLKFRPPSAPEGARLLGHIREGYDLIERGGPSRTYRPLVDHTDLFLELANTSLDPTAIQEFANHYGLLGDLLSGSGEPRREDVNDWLGLIQSLRTAMTMFEESRDNPGLLDELIDLINYNIRPWLTARLERATTGRHLVQLRIVPRSLKSALWLQALNHICDGRQFRQCKACLTWFPYGLGTNQRSTKIFCSDKCRVAWNRRQKREATR